MKNFILQILTLVGYVSVYLILIDYINNSGIVERINIIGIDYFLYFGVGCFTGSFIEKSPKQ